MKTKFKINYFTKDRLLLKIYKKLKIRDYACEISGLTEIIDSVYTGNFLHLFFKTIL